MLNKIEVLNALQKSLSDDLDAAVAQQKRAHADATHEEARPENDKDTRATEQSYLARGLARRVGDLQHAVAAFRSLSVAKNPTQATLCTLVKLVDDDDTESFYFIGPAAGGHHVTLGGIKIRVLTPESPLGKAVVGKRVDDEVTFKSPKGVRELEVVSIS